MPLGRSLDGITDGETPAGSGPPLRPALAGGVLDRVARLAAASAGAPVGMVVLLDGATPVVAAVAREPHAGAEGSHAQVPELAAGVVLEGDTEGLVAGWREAGRSTGRALGLHGVLSVPFRDLDGQIAGAVCAGDTAARAWREVDLERLGDLTALLEGELALRHEAEARGRALAERGALEERLRDAQKLEAVGRLAHGVAHDFNNLLTVVGTSARFVREAVCDVLPPALAAEAAADLDEIEHAVRSAGTLTRQLLACGRARDGWPPRTTSATRVADVVRGVEQMASRVVGGDVEMIALLDGAAGTVLADPGQLEQALLNLVVNARDAMPRGGVLLLEARRAAPDDAVRAGIPAGDWAVVEVSDTGVGADGATRRRLVEPFSTTKPPGLGSGLGLATVYGIVARAGGHVRVHSVPGQGTSFAIYLPRSGDAAGASECADEGVPARVAPRARPGETVLVVEDEAAVRHAARRVLERQGYRVLEARHGVEGLRAWAAYGGAAGRVDLVLTDDSMPEMAGHEFVPRLRARRLRQAVLVMTGLACGGGDGSDWAEAQGLAVVRKPFCAVGLAEQVRAVLDRARAGADPAGRGIRRPR